MSLQGRNCKLIEWVETISSQGWWTSRTASSQLCQSEGHICAAATSEGDARGSGMSHDTTTAAEALTHELSYMELQYDHTYLNLRERHLVTQKVEWLSDTACAQYKSCLSVAGG